ncbi:tape measure protein [Streptococcus koreensis]|uniref:tape measure protein n=1 Tax=Streptococcus koreensis TaxID=2382163 RepID=UPI0022E4D204|nr:tape measure protein [Streptococcus koreensis]
MADGKIVIDVQVNGNKLSALASDLKKLESDANRSSNGFKSASQTLQNAGNQASKAGEGFKKAGDDAGKGGEKAKQATSGFDRLKESIKNFSVGAIAFKAVNAGLDLITSSLDKAIDRFDTMQRFPKVMQSLGHSSKDVAQSTKTLSEGIEGLPTTLDTVVATTQKLTSMTGDLKTSTKLTIALNNAFLASGASTEDASRGLQQYTQMLSAGKVDMQSWKTLQETMPYALQKTAESFGFAGASAQKDFYAALQSGQITFQDFSKRLIELNKGTNGFAEMARKNSEGIRTSFGNIVNAVAKGIANVIDAFDKLSKAVTGKSIAQNLDSIKAVVNSVFKFIVDAINGATPILKGFVQALGYLKPILDPLLHALGGAVVAILAFKGAMLGLAIIKGIGGLIGNLVTSLTTLASTSLVAEGATAGLAGTLATLSSGGIFLVIGALAGLAAALSQDSEAMKEAKAKAEEYQQSIKNLNDSVKTGNESYEDRRREIKATAEDNERLVKKIEELSHVENKTAAQKKELASSAEILNSRIDGLNISYDKVTGTINMTADAIRKQIEISKQSAEAEAANQRLVEIAKQRLEVDDKIADVKKKQKEELEKLDNAEGKYGASILSNSAKEEIRNGILEDSAEKIKSLEESKKSLADSEQRATDIIASANEAQAKAVEDASGRMKLSWDTMDDSQRKLVEDMRAQYEALRGDVQNAFQAIEQQTALSAEQMTANLQQNIDAVDKWSQNLEILAQRGLDQGLIEQMRQAGPKMAEQTQALVNASDEQLGALNGKWTEAGDKAKEGFLRGIRATGVELAPEVQAMVTAIGDEFRQALIDAGFDVKGREVATKTAEGIRAGQPDVQQATSEMTEASKQAFNNLPTEAKYSGGQVSGSYAQGISESSPLVQTASDFIKSTAIGAMSTLAGEGQTAGSNFGGGISTGINSSQGSVTGASLGMTLAAAGQMISMSIKGMTAGQQFGGGISLGIGLKQGQVSSSSKGLQSSAKQSVASLGTDGRQAGHQFGSGVAGGVSSQGGAVGGASSHLRSVAHANMSGGFGGGYNAGLSIGEGLSAGIYAMAGSVASAAASIAGAAVSAARSALRINSPSKVFRDQIGRAIPEGMAVGIEKFSYYVDDSMTGLSKDVIDAGKALADRVSFTPESALGLTGSIGPSFGSGSVSNSSVTNNYTLNANGTANDNFFSPENMRRLLREMAYYTNLEGGRMA